MKSRSRSDPQKTLVGFVVGDLPYAIEISRVVQIINPLPLSPLPHLPEAVTGVADYRGDVVPVVDLRTRFGLAKTEVTRRTKWMIVRVGELPVALVVDGVSDVFGTAGADMRPAPGLSGDDRRGILGVTTHDGKLTFVLDLLRLRPLVDAMSASLRQSSSAGPRGSVGPRS